jgi:hypothetical protein
MAGNVPAIPRARSIQMEVKNVSGMRFTQFSSQSIIALMEWIGGDGHSVLGLDSLDDRRVRLLGFTPKEWVIFGSKAEWFESDLSDPKSTISDKDGNPINVLGWHTLEVSWKIARDIGADTEEASSKFGRGSQASALATAIHARLAEICDMVTNEHGEVSRSAVMLPIATILGTEVAA